jgi:hypothetical protein
MRRERYCTACNSAHTIAERDVADQVCPKIAAPALPAVRKAPIYVVCFRGSDSARDLADALVDEGIAAKRIKTQEGYAAAVAKGRGLLIAWGEALGNTGNMAVLNRNIVKDKFVEITKMRNAGVAVPDLRAVATAGYIGRARHHQSANDLRNPAAHPPAFWTKKLDIAEEWRVHVFADKSIRVGRKEKGNDETPAANAHPWIRSLSTGWKLNYGASLKGNPKGELVRGMAKSAVAALQLNFGAVDCYITTAGDVGVFEVNTAPSISNDNTATAYAKAIASILT